MQIPSNVLRRAIFFTAIALMRIYTSGPYCNAQGVGAIPEDEIIGMAQHDKLGFLKHAIENYEKSTRDYTGIFYKQERLNGRLGKENKIAFKFKEAPYSVYLEWLENAKETDRLLYVKGQREDKMLVHPTGLFGFIKSVKRDPRGKDALKSSLYTCDEFGFYNTLKRIIGYYEMGTQSGDLVIEYTGIENVDGRRCISFEGFLPNKACYDTARMVAKFDVEYLVPVVLERYDWDDRLLFRSSFKDLAFNVGLQDQSFTPAACGL